MFGSMKTMLRAGVASGVVLGAMASAPAFAQQEQASAADNSGSVIVVTAKSREQDLQDVPLSISVFNADDIADRGITDVRDLANFTPNFNIYSGDGRQNASGTSVRGLAPNTSDERYQPVSYFIDGIFVGGITTGLSVIDVERVEVIKGPQSATYGRATYAGAIDFVTTTPSLDSWGGRVEATLSSHEEAGLNYDVTGYIEGPIIQDSLSISLFGQRKFRDGFDQISGGQFPEAGQEETTAFSGVIYAQLTDSTSLKLRAIYSEENDQEALVHTTHPQYWESQGADIVTLGNGELWLQGNVPDPIRSGIRGVDLPVPSINASRAPEEGGYYRERLMFNAILEHDFDNGMNLSYRGSYGQNEYDALVDFRSRSAVVGAIDPVFGPIAATDVVPFRLSFPFPFQEVFKETSHQLRLLSPDDQALTWSLGLYYYDMSDKNFQFRADIAGPVGNEARQSRGTESVENYAAFGSLGYEFSDQFRASVEARISRETIGFDGLPTASSSGARFEGNLRSSNTNVDPRVTLEFTPNDDQLFYVLFAKGVKSGRYNTSSALPASARVNGLNSPESYIFAPQEKLFNYEAGSKTTFADGRGTLNVAVFYQDIKDQQLRQAFQIVIDGQTENVNQIFTAGDSRTWGFEVATSFAVNNDLTLSATLGYADHEFADDIDPNISSDVDIFNFVDNNNPTLKGKTSVNVPKWTGTASFDYGTDISSSLDFRLRGDVIYTGEKFVTLANLATIPDYFLVNMRAGIEADSWDISLFVNNLFDDETALGAGLTSSSTCEFRRNGPNLPMNIGASQRCLFLQPQRGRELGVQVKTRF